MPGGASELPPIGLCRAVGNQSDGEAILAAEMIDVDDSPDYGCGGFIGEGKDMARQMLRTGRSRRPESSLTIVGPVVTVAGWTGPLSKPDHDSMDLRAQYWAAKGF